ncbi:MAG: ABC transporter permease [Deltaproteobacteria bacterium]|nr:ABC transporter permease [Deltaproteobacteria bacterium]
MLVLTGRLDVESTARLWSEALAVARAARGRPLVVDAAGVDYCDGSGAALLAALEHEAGQGGGGFALRGLRDDLRRLVALVAPGPPHGEAPARPAPVIARLGRATLAALADGRRFVAFVGETVLALAFVLRHPGKLRLGETLLVAERAGVGAIPIVAGVGFLLGLILAFQGAIPMRRFAAEIFVADLLGLSLLRELGPLMASILLAARSGSAFAAEIGTMKVNEEIDALTTMGLDPVRFLVVPRVVAAVAVVPALAMLTSLAGLLGGLLVYVSLGFPPVTYLNRIADMVDPGDVIGGLAKAMVFGVIVAAVGCLRGIQTGQGAQAVGLSTTSAVVSGIVGIALADGAFAVVFYVLGI